MANPVVDLEGAEFTFNEGDPATVIAPDAILTDTGSPSVLDVFFDSSGPGDVLGFDAEGLVGSSTSDGTNYVISYNGVSVADATFGSSAEINFYNGVSIDAAQAILRDITFSNDSDNPGTDDRVVHVSLTDADTSAIADQTATIHMVPVNDAPVLQPDTDVFVTAGDPPALVAPNATLADPDSDFSAGSLQITETGGSTDDLFSIVDQGTGAGQIGFDGTNITYEGTQIGAVTFTDGQSMGIDFQSGASVTAVEALVKDISFSYFNTGTFDASDRIVTFTLADGDGATVTPATTIHVAASAHAPELNQQYTATFADDGTGPYSLHIGAPTDADGDTLVVTIDAVPTYGTVEYFDGTNFVTLTGGEHLTADELTTLQYTPADAGEMGGGSLQYTVSDGTTGVHGQIDIHDVGEEEGAIGGYPAAFFSAQGPAPATGPDLYFLPSFPIGPQPVPLGATSDGSSAGEYGGYAHFNGAMFFFADVDDGFGNVLPAQLMGIDDSGPFAIDGVNDTLGLDPHFTVFDGNLYMAGSYADPSNPGTSYDGQLIELQADGTVDPIALTAVNPAFSLTDHGGFTELGGSLYFAAFMDGSGNTSANPDLIRLDANGSLTDISTRTDVSTGSNAGEDGGIFAFGNSIYFNAVSDVVGHDTLFRLDAGSTTPVEVDPSGGVLTHATGVDSAFHIFNGNLYFNEQAPTGDTLFQMDAGGALTALSYGGEALVNAGVSGYGDLGDSLYFTASTSATGNDLFKLDASGTLTAVDLNPGAGDSNAGEGGGFAQFAGALYFFADDANNSGAETLFRMDSSGTATPVVDGHTGTALLLGSGQDAHFTTFGDELLLQAVTPDGDELVEVQPDGTALVDDINTDIPGDSFPGANGGFGIQGLTTLMGTNGNDILVGCTELDYLNGGPGNDLLEGRALNDILTGGDGADIFKFSQDGQANVDLVTDYTLAAGDKIDVTDLLSAFDPGAGDAVTDFVHVAQFETGLMVYVDEDGTGANSDWQPVALLEGVSGSVKITVPVTGDITMSEDFSPTLALSGAPTQTAIEQTALVLDAGITVGDDSGMLASAEVFITNGTFAGPEDTLQIDLSGTSITVDPSSVAGELHLVGNASVADYQKVLRTVTYTDTSDTPDTSHRHIQFSVNDGFSDSIVSTVTIHVAAVDDAPVLAGAGSTVGYTEQAAAVTLEGGITADDVDDDNLQGATVAITNAVAGDRLTINGATSGTLIGADGTISYSFTGNTLALTGADSLADYQAALQLVSFDSTSDDPDARGTNQHRTIDWQVTDPSSVASTVMHTTVDITAVDDPAVAHNDAFTTDVATAIGAGANLVTVDNGFGADSDPDGPAITVTQVQGDAAKLNTQVTLASGALLTVHADGTFSYDPNHAFDSLHLASPSTGAANSSTTDTFAYTVDGGSTATVTVTVAGIDDSSTVYVGDASHTDINGGPGGHLFDLTAAADYTVTGGSGNDGFKFADTFDGNDLVDGGGGTNNQMQVGGVYHSTIVLDPAKVTNVQVLAFVPGDDYSVRTLAGFVGTGHTFTFWSVSMGSGNGVTIDGSAETDGGKFNFYLGQGNDTATGGTGNDLFYGEGGADHLTGGGGSDTFAYLAPSDSNAADHDTLDFTAGTDKLLLSGTTVGAVNTAFSGSLSAASLDSDLTALLGHGAAHELDTNRAVVITGDSGGDLNGHTFLIVGTSGAASGYTTGADYVFDITAGSAAGLSTSDFI